VAGLRDRAGSDRAQSACDRRPAGRCDRRRSPRAPHPRAVRRDAAPGSRPTPGDRYRYARLGAADRIRHVVRAGREPFAPARQPRIRRAAAQRGGGRRGGGASDLDLGDLGSGRRLAARRHQSARHCRGRASPRRRCERCNRPAAVDHDRRAGGPVRSSRGHPPRRRADRGAFESAAGHPVRGRAMTAPVALARVGLDAEWNRVELMARQVADRRVNRSPEPGVVASLASLRRDVTELRSADAAWNRVANGDLTSLDPDVLACVIAPGVEPRIRWLYQELQGGTTQPYPTRALLQELLDISPAELHELAAVWSDDAALLRLGLIECDGVGPFSLIPPAPGVTAPPPRQPPPPATPPRTPPPPPPARRGDPLPPRGPRAVTRPHAGW